MRSRLAFALAAGMSAALAAQAPDPQRPVFRAGAHFVRVDVYPTRDGQPLTGLKAEDFELLEDGKPQKIETLEFIEFPILTTNADRRDPNSQRGGLELAKDPQYRVFVLYLDAFHVSLSGSNRASLPVVDFLNRMIGPKDLFGVLTPAQRPDIDLMLGQLTQTISQQLTDHRDWGIADRYQPQPGEIELEAAFPRNPAFAKHLIALRRLDKVYGDLEQLVGILGDLREERKNIVFFSDTLPSPPTNVSQLAVDPTGGSGAPPRIGVGSDGKLTMGARNSSEVDRRRAEDERARLTSIDFSQRFRTLLRSARQANVSFYTVRPGGLDSNYSMLSDGISNLRVLADETDGAAVMGSNDLRAGLTKVTNDLSSHYVLGYYTANTTWNGGTRRLTVKLKGTGQTLRARREYRAPTAAEMAAIRNASAAPAAPAAPTPRETAFDALARLRPAAVFNAHGTVTPAGVTIVAELSAAEIEGGRWKQGADVQVLLTGEKGETSSGRGRIEPGARGTVIKVPVGAQQGPWQVMVRVSGEGQTPQTDGITVTRRTAGLLGEPIAFRAASAASAPFQPLAAFHFRRTERLRLEWPALVALDAHDARLLDRKGQPLGVPVTVTARDADGGKLVVADVNLSPLSNGEYLIELTAKSGATVEQRLIAIRVSNAR
jgi:VWFA-related protein